MIIKLLVKNLETGHFEKVKIDTKKDTNYQKAVEKMIVKLEKQNEEQKEMTKEEWAKTAETFESLTGDKL